MAGRIEFWFEFGSTYSYLSAMRIERVAGAAGVAVEWKPFLLGPIFQSQGWNDSPFNLYPVKGRYMWRDMERLCGREGLPWRRPTRFPRSGLLAARVTCAVAGESWCPDLVRRIYRANFAEDREISEAGTIGEILDGLGQSSRQILERAQSQEIKDALRRRTEEAAARGIFGAPSFLVGEELFWGNDRLEQALEVVARS
jgi:2-hydroxychromene-2-carboxylate isomerase